MLRIALPNKGSLSEGAIDLAREAGYRCRPDSRELMLLDADNDVQFVFLRPRDIAVYVGRGILDLGITGRDLALDSEADVIELLSLGFGKSTFRYAVPKGSGLTPADFGGLRVATSYPKLVAADLRRRGITAGIVRLDGAVEISISLGVADAIADVVESGRTLAQAGLEVIGDPILMSEAVLIARDASLRDEPSVLQFVRRLEGIIVARKYVMVEYDVPKAALEQACAVTPGIESPTVAPLSKPDWMAVKAMALRSEVNAIMDDLAEIGATGIIITDIRTCRI